MAGTGSVPHSARRIRPWGRIPPQMSKSLQADRLDELTLQQPLNVSRQRGIEEWLAQRPMVLMEYDDALTRRLAEKIAVAYGETIQVKLRNVAMEIEQELADGKGKFESDCQKWIERK